LKNEYQVNQAEVTGPEANGNDFAFLVEHEIEHLAKPVRKPPFVTVIMDGAVKSTSSPPHQRIDMYENLLNKDSNPS